MAENQENGTPENTFDPVQFGIDHADEINELLTKMKQKAVGRFEQKLYKDEVNYQAWSKHAKGVIVVNEERIEVYLYAAGSGDKVSSLIFHRNGGVNLKKNSKGVLTPYTDEFNEDLVSKHMDELMLLTSLGVFGDD